MAEIDTALTRQYLLGELSESAEEAFEERYFADPEALEAVEAVESDLVDDYVRSALPHSELRLFESHYLRSEPHRQRVTFARALLSSVDGSRPAASAGASIRPLWLGAAATLALAAGWLVWGRSTTPPQESGQIGANQVLPKAAPPVAAPSSGPDAPPPQAVSPPESRRPERATVSVLLSPLLLRGEETEAPVAVPPGATDVELRLEGDLTGFERFRVTVNVVVGPIVWSSSSVGPQRKGVVVVSVPAMRLPPDDYIVALDGLSQGGWEAVHRYSLRVGEGNTQP